MDFHFLNTSAFKLNLRKVEKDAEAESSIYRQSLDKLHRTLSLFLSIAITWIGIHNHDSSSQRFYDSALVNCELLQLEYWNRTITKSSNLFFKLQVTFQGRIPVVVVIQSVNALTLVKTAEGAPRVPQGVTPHDAMPTRTKLLGEVSWTNGPPKSPVNQ